jgi:hypothetical protein
MNKLMTSSWNIMADVKAMLMEVSREQRCSYEEVVETMEKFMNVLFISDALFSMARTSSGLISIGNSDKLQNLVHLALKLWRGIDLSITPKVHAMKEHLVDKSGVKKKLVMLERI